MKKLITVILILAMLLPAAALADTPAWLYEGTWACTTYNATEGISLVVISLQEDGTAYYMAQMFGAKEPGAGRAFVGSWEISGPDTIHVITGNNTSMDLRYCTFNMMYNDQLRQMFFRSEMRDGDRW